MKQLLPLTLLLSGGCEATVGAMVPAQLPADARAVRDAARPSPLDAAASADVAQVSLDAPRPTSPPDVMPPSSSPDAPPDLRTAEAPSPPDARTPDAHQAYVPGPKWQPPPPTPPGPGHFVDSRNGDDARDGRSPATAWRSLAKLQETSRARLWKPGDVIHLARGSVFDGGFEIWSSGQPQAPITFTSYGEGPLPLLRKTLTKQPSERIIHLRGSHVVIQGLAFRDGFDGAIYIYEGANHNVVSGVEASNVTIGVKIWGEHNLVTRSYFHDLVYGTDGATIDGLAACWGANGISINNSFNEISYNVFIRNRGTCKVAAYGGYDGTAIEIDGFTRPKNGIRIHHNYSRECQGFMEVSGTTFNDAVVSHNVSDDYEKFIAFAIGGPWKAKVSNLRVEHNTVIFTRDDDPVFGYWDRNPGEPLPPPFMTYRNNIFFTRNQRVSPDYPAMPHDHNLYFRTDGSKDIGAPLGAGEVIADPRFVDPAIANYRLRPDSPAIDRGAVLGHDRDLDGRAIPQGKAPDIGAFEH